MGKDAIGGVYDVGLEKRRMHKEFSSSGIGIGITNVDSRVFKHTNKYMQAK